MISVIVTYKVRKDYVDQNKANIQKFMADFEKLNTSDFQYNVFTEQDGLTFIHHSLYKNEHIQKEVLHVPSFLKFQKERDEIGIDGKPEIAFIDLVETSNRHWKK